MNYQTAIINPQQKIVRKATAFAGRYLNIYPWPVASFVTRVHVVAGGASGPVLLGNTGGFETNVFANPSSMSLASSQYNGTGIFSLDATGIGTLLLDFGATLSSSDIYVEGYGADSTYNVLDDYTISIYGQHEPRYPASAFSRILTGDSSAPSAALMNISPVIFKPNSVSGITANTTLTNNLTLYIGCNTKFAGIQFNIATEDYTRADTYSMSYWNGAWSALGGSIYSNLSSTDTTSIIFNQSGIVKYTAPSDWIPTTLNGDPYLAYLNNINTEYDGQPPYGSQQAVPNMTYSANQYWIRLNAPALNTESVGLISMCLFNY